MFKDIKAKIQKIESSITRAIGAEDAARQAYLESRNERLHDTQEAINTFQELLEVARAENELLPQQLVAALINGDKDAKTTIEEKIIVTSAYIRNLEDSLETLNRASPKGHPDLYADLIKSNNAKAAALIDARKAVNSIKVLTASLISDLSAIQTSMELKFKSKFMELIDQPDMQLIEIVESYEGPIDVTGHTAGMNGIAKMRYIHGNINGIEGTPAGKKLIAKGRN